MKALCAIFMMAGWLSFVALVASIAAHHQSAVILGLGLCSSLFSWCGLITSFALGD